MKGKTGQRRFKSKNSQVCFFPSFSAIFNRKMQKLPLFSCILLRNDGKHRSVMLHTEDPGLNGKKYTFKTIHNAYKKSYRNIQKNNTCKKCLRIPDLPGDYPKRAF